MAAALKVTLGPRKVPSQARAKVTVASIFLAAIQLLKRDGVTKLTTTRVAERAGVSVGTMYQYFPNKNALFYALLQQHLEIVATAIDGAAERSFGMDCRTIAEELVTTYLDIKASHLQASQALYGIASDKESAALMRASAVRMEATVSIVLSSARGARFADVDAVSFTIAHSMAGAVRALMAQGSTLSFSELRAQMLVMVMAYIAAASS